MSEFDLRDLEKISKSGELLDLLVEKNIIKEGKFKKQLAYERELNTLQFELLRLQQYVATNKQRLLLIFEGRDAAGKGGTISRLIAKLNPKKYRVVALPKPNAEEQAQWYFQRYIKELPREGEMVLFDRSWYNRALVEPVFDFCTKEQYRQFIREVTRFEKLLVDDGILLIKFFLTISKQEQQERLEERKADPMKQWKIGDLDMHAQEKWDDYAYYIDQLFEETATKKSPWIEIVTDDKKVARLEVMKYVLLHSGNYQCQHPLQNDKAVVKKRT
ncbi:polyphosphate kinase 2 [Olivibacter ginsenosidimutans]|uniref:ADP/GDP-polyphosphate phosphotransferase n=1 Tax=Olivibacter ginsenosidimutans TaxID=1176537 RepID=A0ABP9CGB5_9SPHI